MFWIRRGSEPAIRRRDQIPLDQADWYKRFFHAAVARGVYLPPSAYEVGFLSLAHDDATLKMAVDALVAAAAEVEA
jgi:glutamate-1-semialdehyde 2,1-aminomutase